MTVYLLLSLNAFAIVLVHSLMYFSSIFLPMVGVGTLTKIISELLIA